MKKHVGCQFLKNLNLIDLSQLDMELCVEKVREHINNCSECKKDFEKLYKKHVEPLNDFIAGMPVDAQPVMVNNQ